MLAVSLHVPGVHRMKMKVLLVLNGLGSCFVSLEHMIVCVPLLLFSMVFVVTCNSLHNFVPLGSWAISLRSSS